MTLNKINVLLIGCSDISYDLPT